MDIRSLMVQTVRLAAMSGCERSGLNKCSASVRLKVPYWAHLQVQIDISFVFACFFFFFFFWGLLMTVIQRHGSWRVAGSEERERDGGWDWIHDVFACQSAVIGQFSQCVVTSQPYRDPDVSFKDTFSGLSVWILSRTCFIIRESENTLSTQSDLSLWLSGPR